MYLRIPNIPTYHPSVERVNKTIIKEFKNYSNLALGKHPFDVTPICSYRHQPKLRNISINQNFHILLHLQAIKSANNRDLRFATSSLQTMRSTFLEQAIFCFHETTTVNFRTLFIS